MESYTLNMEALHMTDDEFFGFCITNKGLNVERNSKMEIEIMPPTGSNTSILNTSLSSQVYNWNQRTRLGYPFDSNAGFTLSNNSVRSPDTAWIEKSRYEKLNPEDRKKFAHICPDFVIELKSESDSIERLKNKMLEYIENGCRLGFLIIPEEKKVYVYKPNRDVIVKSTNEKISGEDVMPGFELDLSFMNQLNL